MTKTRGVAASRWQAFFSNGFRPFFLFASLYAVLGMAAWMIWIGIHALNGEIRNLTIAMPPHYWHAHEMLYGYGVAVVAGFFLTAVPNWTKTGALQGSALGLLVVLWILGRIAMWFSGLLPNWLVALCDLAFIPALLITVIGALVHRGSKRNWIFFPILVLLFAGNGLVHGEQLGWFDDTLVKGHRLALDTIILLITILGGRVIPAFTTNTLRNAKPHKTVTTLPVSRGPIEMVSMASVIGLLAANIFDAPSTWIGGMALLAAAVHAVRLSGWQSLRTLDTPILWVLHLGYLWLIIGFALIGLSELTDYMSPNTALHALTIGAVGTLTVGVMSRAGLGHTGRPIVARRIVVAAYICLSLAAVVRISVSTLPFDYYNYLLMGSGVLWMVGFCCLVWVYLPILTTPRLD